MIAADTIKKVFFNRTALDPAERADAFEIAALPHLRDLYRTALRLLGNAAEAEDVAQETYLQAWKSFHRFEAGTDCRAWLFKIMFNTIHHHRRKSLDARMVKESDDFLEQAAVYKPPVPEEIGDEDVLAALDHLPVDFRAVVLLADVEEFSYKEIAGLLKIPLGTVMSRLSRGREFLRGELGKLAESYGINTVREDAQ